MEKHMICRQKSGVTSEMRAYARRRGMTLAASISSPSVVSLCRAREGPVAGAIWRERRLAKTLLTGWAPADWISVGRPVT